MLDAPGIYQIANTVNGKVYVGQAVNLRKRWNIHRHLLRNGKHTNPALQRAFNKHGEEAFEFEVIETVPVADREILNRLEEHYMDAMRSVEKAYGYNLTAKAGTNLGFKYSDEARARMSAAQRGRTVSADHRAKIAVTLTGSKASAETIDKRRIKLIGKKRTPEQVQNLKSAMMKVNDTPSLKAFGRSQPLNDWAREFGINHATIRNRMRRAGMSLEQALTAPKSKGRRHGLEDLA